MSASLTAHFSEVDPHRMIHTCGLTEGFARPIVHALAYGWVNVNATRCNLVTEPLSGEGEKKPRIMEDQYSSSIALLPRTSGRLIRGILPDYNGFYDSVSPRRPR